MTSSRDRSKLVSSMLSLAAAMLPPMALATEPSHDSITVGGKTGYIFPEKCCWVDLPRNERLRAARYPSMCSALGAPVGRFELKDGKIWLTGFDNCGTQLPVKQIYPEFADPAEAVWLSGKFNTKLDYRCMDRARHRVIFATEQVLVIERGAVVSITEKTSDVSPCDEQMKK